MDDSTRRAIDDSAWWNDLEGQSIYDNAHGVPPYDAKAVAAFIQYWLGLQLIRAGTVLDLGCGPGRLGHALAMSNPQLSFIGVDVAPQMVTLATRGAPLNWRATTVVGSGTLPPDVGSIQGAYSVTVFQHVEHHHVRSYVEQVHAHLVPCGAFIFTYAVGIEDVPRSRQASHDQARGWLLDAGFIDVRRLPTPSTHPAWNWIIGRRLNEQELDAGGTDTQETNEAPIDHNHDAARRDGVRDR